MSEEKKPTIDERIEALTHSLELFQLEQKQHVEQMKLHAAEMKRLDQRERKARQALGAAIAAYIEALDDDEHGRNGDV
jgi:hypothetical protein